MNIARKADRAKLVRLISDIAAHWGASVEVLAHMETARQTYLEVSLPGGLCVLLDLDGAAPDPDTFLLSWVLRGPGRLNTGAFRNINQFHGRKATDIAAGVPTLLAVLTLRMMQAAEGTAYTAEDPLSTPV